MDEFQIPREKMVTHLREVGKIADEQVLAAMNRVPRHLFVPEALKAQAYKDHALPIAAKQTISQPQIVARMSELLGVTHESTVLEIGAGSGYQTAILGCIADKVYAVERVPQLAKDASDILHRLGFKNIRMKCDDGTNGWGDHAPFDGILVAAGGPDVPRPLLEQLKIGASLVIPIGEDERSQRLYRIIRTEEGFKKQDCGPCSFVPLIGEHGW